MWRRVRSVVVVETCRMDKARSSQNYPKVSVADLAPIFDGACDMLKADFFLIGSVTIFDQIDFNS